MLFVHDQAAEEKLVQKGFATKHPHVNASGATKFVDWVTSAAGQNAVASYKIGGEQLFFPNAKP